MSNQTPTVGTLARYTFTPGVHSDTIVEIIEIEGRDIYASIVTPIRIHAPERFTLRKNGNIALAGSDQWSNYLRFDVTEAERAALSNTVHA